MVRLNFIRANDIWDNDFGQIKFRAYILSNKKAFGLMRIRANEIRENSIRANERLPDPDRKKTKGLI